MWLGLNLHQVGPRPSINIHQNRICTFATFGAGAAQRRCPIWSNLGQKCIFLDKLENMEYHRPRFHSMPAIAMQMNHAQVPWILNKAPLDPDRLCLKISDNCWSKVYNTWARRLLNESYGWDSTWNTIDYVTAHVSNTFAYDDSCALRVIVEVDGFVKFYVHWYQHQKNKEAEAQR
jgi:hypothetical protein